MGKKTNRDKNIINEQPLTYDDYAAMDDGKRYELAKGHLELMSPSPSATHQLVSSEIHQIISNSCRQGYFIFTAPIDVILSPSEVRQPDLAILDRKRMATLTKRGIEGAPDLIIEIISPSSLKRDKIDKLVTYADFHIPEYWIVDPKLASLEQHLLKGESYELFNIFQNDETIVSPTIKCILFTMETIMSNIPRLE